MSCMQQSCMHTCLAPLHCNCTLMVEDNGNGLDVEFRCRQYQPCQSEITPWATTPDHSFSTPDHAHGRRCKAGGVRRG